MAHANLKKALTGGAMTVGFFLLPAAALAQHDGSSTSTITTSPILNITEVLTGLSAAFVAFQAAVAYREGRIGRGITWVAVGMVIFILVSRRFSTSTRWASSARREAPSRSPWRCSRASSRPRPGSI
jgi:hypothetical protein